jgi:hypothetical protein
VLEGRTPLNIYIGGVLEGRQSLDNKNQYDVILYIFILLIRIAYRVSGFVQQPQYGAPHVNFIQAGPCVADYTLSPRGGENII